MASSVARRLLPAGLLESPSRQVACAAVVLAIAVAASFGFEQWDRYDAATTRAERDTRNAAVLLAEHAVRTMGGVEETLRAVGRLRADVSRGVYRSQASIYVNLKTLRGGSPFLREVGWYDEYGERVATSLQADAARVSVAQEDIFLAARDAAQRGLHVAAPRRLSGDGAWQILVALRLENLDGTFAGIATGTLDPEEFAKVYRSLDLGPGFRVTLFRRDGVVLAHAPGATETLGRRLADSPLFQTHLTRAASGTYHGPSAIDGTERIAGYASVGSADAGFVVNVAISRRHALAEFWRIFAYDAAGSGLGLLIVFLASRMLVLGLRRRERLQADLYNEIAERRRAETVLRESEQRLRDVTENMPGMVFQKVRRPDGRVEIQFISGSVDRVYGVSAERALAQPRVLASLIHEDDRAKYVDWVRRCVDAVEPGVLEFRGFRRDGKLCWTRAELRPRRRDDGAVVWEEMAIDITREKEAENLLVAEKEKAELANRAKTEFLANMSHELRTPLNAVIGFSDLLKRQNFGPHSHPAYGEYATHIHDSARHLLSIINDILDISKIEAGKGELNENEFAIADVLVSCLNLIDARAKEKGVSIVPHLSPALAAVRADERMVKQIVLNLLSNAVKFTPEGGEVGLSTSIADDGCARIVVADTGIGIAPENIAKVMMPFYQVDGSLTRKFEGTGLGLPLVKSMVELHGGRFELTSTLGVGTTATVWLPAERVLTARTTAAPRKATA